MCLQIDPQLHCDHQHLKSARETQRRIEQDLTQASDQLRSERTRNSQLEQEVENYRVRQKHITDLKHYQMKRPWIVSFRTELVVAVEMISFDRKICSELTVVTVFIMCRYYDCYCCYSVCLQCVQCFDTVGWASGRASGL